MRIVYPKALFISVALLLVVLVLLGYVLAARASMSTFYASTCLGGWEHTHLATGEPQVGSSDTAPTFTEENSARLIGNTHAQIYCGGFLGDIVDNTLPKNILVKFSWTAEYPLEEGESSGGGEADVPEIETEEPATPSTESTDGSLPQEEGTSIPPEVVEDAVPEPSQEEQGSGEAPTISPQEDAPIPPPEPSPTPILEDPVVSLLSFLAISAHAEEGEVVPEPVSEEVFDIASTTEAVATSSSPVSTPTSAYGLVEVLYTLDGVLWKTLGFVSKDEFSNTEFEIPMEEIVDWDDVSKIQIAVQSVPVVDGLAPIIYLDSVWIEAAYDVVQTESDMYLASLIEALDPALLPELIPELFQDTEPVPQEENDEEATRAFEAERMITEEPHPVTILPESRLLPARVFSKEFIVDAFAEHACEVSPFSIDMSSRSVGEAEVIVQGTIPGERYELEVGSLPEGITVVFESTGEHVYILSEDDVSIPLRITKEEFFQEGDLSVLLFFTKWGESSSTVTCQANFVTI